MNTRAYIYTVKYGNGDIDRTKFAFTSDSKIYAIVRGVSKSGMSRRLSFFMVEDSELINITHVIAQVLGKKLNNKECSFRVKGCGMDMIFATLSAFASRIGFKKDPYWCEHYYRI